MVHGPQNCGSHKRLVERICNYFKRLDFPEGKEKYRGVFEIQRSGDKASSGKIGLDIRRKQLQ